MAILADHVPLTLSTGTSLLGPFPVQDAVSEIQASLARCTSATPTVWPNTSTTIAITVECSVDNGISFGVVASATAQGGIHTQLNGVQAAATTVKAPLPTGSKRQVRCLYTVANGPLVTTGTLEVL